MFAKISSISEALERCPGITGELARHLNSLQETDQPGICLSSAISFMSVLRAGRVKSKSGLSPNVYSLVLGRSGSGKTRCQQRIIDICQECGFDSFLMGKPASDSGILKSIQKQPRQLLIWDEFGQALNEISRTTSSYRAAIVATVMEIYSSNGRQYIGKEYATQARVDIQAPYLSIAAASTIKEFYSALTMQFLEKGFLSRWIVIEGNPIVERKQKKEYPLQAEVLKGIERLEWAPCGDNMTTMDFDDPEMEKLLLDMSWIRREKAKSEIEHILWSRAYENAIKQCLIYSDEFGKCSNDAARFAWYFQEFCIDELVKRCNTDVHEDHREKLIAEKAKKFQSLLVPGELVSKTEIYNRAHNRHIRGQEFRWLFQDMIDSESWVKSIGVHPVTNNCIDLYSCASTGVASSGNRVCGTPTGQTGHLQVPVSTTKQDTEKIT